MAILSGTSEEVAAALARGTPKQQKDWALQWAAARGDVGTVRDLLKSKPTRESAILSLRRAATLGHLEVAALLIPVGVPRQNYSRALREAAEKGHTAVVVLLLPVSSLKSAWNHTLATKDWRGVDGLSLYVPISWLVPVLKHAPESALLTKMKARVAQDAHVRLAAKMPMPTNTPSSAVVRERM